MALTC